MAKVHANACSLLAHPKVIKELSEAPGVEWVGHFSPNCKFSLPLEVPFPSTQYGNLLAFDVLLADSSSAHLLDAQSTVDRINAEFQAEGTAAQLLATTARHWTLLVEPTADLQSAVLRAASIEDVAWIAPETRKQLRNNAASWILQSNAPEQKPIYDSEITGKGVLVGVSDTGSDFNNCLLGDSMEPQFCASACSVRNLYEDPTCWDRNLADPSVCAPANSFPTCKFTGSDCQVRHEENDPGHRKLAIYWNFTDKLDDYVGHGSHTTGSVAGSTQNASLVENFHGTAPDAKLLFFDMGNSAAPDSLYTPPDLYTNYFPFFYDNGAYIVSQSWGSMGYCDTQGVPQMYFYSSSTWGMLSICGIYDSTAHDIDKFVREHDQQLVLFAAGNDGDSGFFTVGNEASNKNGLAVGATRTNFDHMYYEVAPYNVAEMIDQVCSGTAFWGGDICTYYQVEISDFVLYTMLFICF